MVDVTNPDRPVICAEHAHLPLSSANRIFGVAHLRRSSPAGRDGLAILDVERPEHPFVKTMATADGKLNDARDVVHRRDLNASLFAYVADGANGLKVC